MLELRDDVILHPVLQIVVDLLIQRNRRTLELGMIAENLLHVHRHRVHRRRERRNDAGDAINQARNQQDEQPRQNRKHDGKRQEHCNCRRGDLHPMVCPAQPLAREPQDVFPKIVVNRREQVGDDQTVDDRHENADEPADQFLERRGAVDAEKDQQNKGADNNDRHAPACILF